MPATGIHDHPAFKLGLIPPDPARVAAMIQLPLRSVLGLDVPPAVEHLGAAQPAMVLGANDRFGTCLVPATRVLTADLRWVPVGEVLPGDRLLGFDEHRRNRCGRYYAGAEVTQADRVVKPCYDLVFDDGTRVRCSADHRWLTASTVQGQLRTQQWAHATDLIPGRSQVIKPLDVWADDLSRDGGYLAGAFDGEGSLDQTRHGVYANRIKFGQAPNPMLDEVERALKAAGYRYKHRVMPGGRMRPRADGSDRLDKHVLEVTPRPEFVRFLGSVRPARLLPALDIDRLGQINGRTVTLVSKTYAGDHEVVRLETSTGTYLAEGLASHNCWPTSVANSAILTTLFCRGERVTVTDQSVFALYRQSGNPDFDEHTGAGDRGVDPVEGFKALMANGIEVTHLNEAGDPDPASTEILTPVCYAAASVATVEDLKAITYAAGGALMCLDLQQSQQGQTASGLWDYQHAPMWGGHAVLGGSYSSPASASASDEVVETWGRQVGTTDRFIGHQLAAVFVAVWRDLWSADPFTAAVPREQLAAAYEDVTGRPIQAPGQ